MSKKRKPKQLEFDQVNGWGGKRKNAGRINKTHTVNHMTREKVGLKTPLHLSLRLLDKLPSLRSKTLLKHFTKCIKGARAQGLYIVHFSIQSNHIHLFAEAEGNRELALGMRALAGRFAKIIRKNASLNSKSNPKSYSKRGPVFKGRYHLHVLKTPTETKNALEYVLLNLSKHQKLIEYMDQFSSARFFKEWRKLLGRRFGQLIKADVDFFRENKDHLGEVEISPPKSWLAREGWTRAA